MKLDFFSVKLTNDRLVFLVKIESGWGEIAPLEMNDQDHEKIKTALCQLQEELKPIGKIKKEEIPFFLDRFNFAPLSYGIEQALLHHYANIKEKSLAELLCDQNKPLTKVKINALIPRVSVYEATKLTTEFLTKGFTTIKIKVGSSNIQDDVCRVKAVRERAGKEIKIHLDANGRWHKNNVLTNLTLLANFGIEYIEQPLPTLTDMAWLKDQSPIPIAVDEAVSSLSDLQEAIKLDCCHLVVIKPMFWGGLLQAYQGLKLAQSKGLPVVLTGTLEGPIGRWGVYELARAGQIDRGCGLTGYGYQKGSVIKEISI
jgi:o-succinylbenzoate synthase